MLISLGHCTEENFKKLTEWSVYLGKKGIITTEKIISDLTFYAPSFPTLFPEAVQYITHSCAKKNPDQTQAMQIEPMTGKSFIINNYNHHTYSLGNQPQIQPTQPSAQNNRPQLNFNTPEALLLTDAINFVVPYEKINALAVSKVVLTTDLDNLTAEFNAITKSIADIDRESKINTERKKDLGEQKKIVSARIQQVRSRKNSIISIGTKNEISIETEKNAEFMKRLATLQHTPKNVDFKTCTYVSSQGRVCNSKFKGNQTFCNSCCKKYF